MHFCELLAINGLKQNLQYGPAWHSPGINWSKFRGFVQNLKKKKVRKMKKSIFALAENHPCKTDTWKYSVSSRLFSPNHCVISQISHFVRYSAPGQIYCGTASFLFEVGAVHYECYGKNYMKCSKNV